MIDTIFCPWENPTYMLFSSNIPFLLPYSHFLAIIAAVMSSVFVLKVRRQAFGKMFLFMSLFFCLWVLFDWHIWATNNPSVVMFVWTLQILLEIFIYIAALFLTYAFVRNESVPKRYILTATFLALPFIIAMPTQHILQNIDVSICDATENPLVIYYSYAIEILVILGIIRIIGRQISKDNRAEQSATILFGTGIITFLLGFTSGNIIGSLTENWTIAQFGLFGMPIFLGILSFTILKYKSVFNAKVITAQVLVSILWILTAGILFLRTIPRVRIVTSISLLLLTTIGYVLIRSVKREVEQRERIEKLARDLEEANSKLRELDEMKSEFLSLASHQLRSPLTAMKGYSSMMLEGDYGEMPLRAKEAVRTIFTSSQNLINIVNDFLDISRIEQGRMIYQKNPFDLIKSARDVVISLEPNIRKAGLDLVIDVPKNFEAVVKGDETKIKQVISNLIDNAVKYTVHGSIVISAHVEKGKARIEITDTGLGLEKEEIAKLFTKFMRMKDAYKTNVTGTGLGLYIAKKMIEAHGGFIGATSKGKGQGSTFWFELPTVN